MTLHREMETMLRLGAYRPGTDPETDAAIAAHEPLEKFLATGSERPTTVESFGLLKAILASATPTSAAQPRGQVPRRR